jgi:hypothetical protein
VLEIARLAGPGAVVTDRRAAGGDGRGQNPPDLGVKPAMVVRGQAARRLRRVDAGGEERLVRVDVADPRQQPLIHQHLLHRLARAPQRRPQPGGSELGRERLGADRGAVPRPARRVEQEQLADAAHVAVHQLAPVVERSPEHGIAALIGRERTIVHDEGARHAGLHDEPILAQIDHRVLRPPVDRADGRTAQPSDEAAPRHAPQDVVVAQGDSAEGTADEGGADVADHRFDFGKLGHRAEM